MKIKLLLLLYYIIIIIATSVENILAVDVYGGRRLLQYKATN